MATIDYKQKIKDYMNSSEVDTLYKSMLNNLFPELRESEDERIRKELLQIAKESEDSFYMVMTPNKRETLIAWLEKQAEKTNPYSGISFEYNGHVWGMCARDNGVDILLDKQLFKHLEKQGEQKFAWGYEDERNLDWLTTVCERIHYKSDPQVSSESALMLKEWLKSLKDRVLSQPKQEWQEWSEEDEGFLNLLLAVFTNEHPNGVFTTDNITVFKGNCVTSNRIIAWLKSLRPQWKPSGEQIDALNFAANCVVPAEFCIIRKVLKGLLEQLKKLKGEQL